MSPTSQLAAYKHPELVQTFIKTNAMPAYQAYIGRKALIKNTEIHLNNACDCFHTQTLKITF